MAVTKETNTPLRLSLKTAGRQLDVSAQTVRNLVRDGVLTGLPPLDPDSRSRTFVLPGEVEAFAKGGPAAVKAWRKQHRIPEPKGGK